MAGAGADGGEGAGGRVHCQGRVRQDPHVPPPTLRPTPYTLHPTPYALHPTPYTLHPTQPRPQTVNQKKRTPNSASTRPPPHPHHHLARSVADAELLHTNPDVWCYLTYSAYDVFLQKQIPPKIRQPTLDMSENKE